MLKKYTSLLCILSLDLVQAQTHRFIYELKFKLDSTATDFEQVNMVLDVNPKEVKFYDFEFLERDSINRAKNSQNLYWGYQNIVVRKRNSFQHNNYEMLDNLFQYETHDPIKWDLHKDIKREGGYFLQKATTHFGGRFWVAWFASEIPYFEGPYKFQGLPGLIFQISDSNNQYVFKLLKSKKLPKTYDTSGFIESGVIKPIKITRDKLDKLKMDYYNDPLKDFRLQFDENPNTKYYVGGVQITDKGQFKEMAEKEREAIRKENNPIEIDTVIHYPEK